MNFSSTYAYPAINLNFACNEYLNARSVGPQGECEGLDNMRDYFV